jgi:hypothetical protein
MVRLEVKDTTSWPKGATNLRFTVYLVTEDTEVPILEISADKEREKVELTVLDSSFVKEIYLEG